ncbi:MAG: protein kinase [Myxococcota bacterium]|nr:protein kinase [Myxococcota bacterium]
MKSPHDILRGEIERLFSTAELNQLVVDYLGMNPEEMGVSDGSRAVFARRLVEWCEQEKASQALADAVFMAKQTQVSQKLRKIYNERFSSRDLAAGTDIAGYVVKEKKQDAGLWSVYLCDRATAGYSEDDDAYVAEYGAEYGLKLINPGYALDTQATQRFKTYMRAFILDKTLATQQVEAVGDLDDGRPYFVFQWDESEPLRARLPVPVSEALDIFEAILDALTPLHERGFFHGDLNPDTVLVCSSETAFIDSSVPKICFCDFGMDRLVHRPGADASASPLCGYVWGRAPEQARGAEPTAASDIYALGALLYEVIAGRSPFAGDTPIDVIAAHLNQQVPLLSEAVTDPLAAAVDDFVQTLMAKEQERRPRDIDAVRARLNDVRRAADEITARAAQTGTREDIELYVQDFLVDPADEIAFDALKEGADQYNAWGAAVDVIEEAGESAADEILSRHLLLEAARISREVLKDYERAAEIYDGLLSSTPEDPEVKAAAIDLMRIRGQYDALVTELAAQAEAEEVPEKKGEIIRNIGDVYYENLKDPERAFDYYLAYAETADQDDALIERLGKLSERTERHAEFAGHCYEMAQQAETTGDIDAALSLYKKAGVIYFDKVNEPEYALTCLQKVLEHEPADVEALQTVAQIYLSAEQWGEYAEVLIHLSEAEPLPEARRDHKAAAGQVLYERLGNTEGAIELLEATLAEDPTHDKAASLLATIYEGAGTWDRLTALLEGTVDALPEGPARASGFYRLGQLYEEQLDDLTAAGEHYENVLTVDADHMEAMKGLERIYARTGDVAKLRSNLETQLDIAASAKQQLVIKERLALICEEEFKQYDDAIQYLVSVLEIDGNHPSARTSLARLYRLTGDWEALAEILAEQANRVDLDERKALLKERATIIREQLGDAQRAAAAFAEVASLGVDDALETLAKTQEDAGDYDAAIDTILKMADVAPDSDAKIGLLLRVATIQLELKQVPAEAVATLRALRDLVPENRAVLAQLKKALVAEGNYAAVLDVLGQEVLLVEGPSARAGLIAEMGVICVDNIGDTERAVEYFEQALLLDETNFIAGDRVSELYRKNNEWEKALPIYLRWADSADALPQDKQLELFTHLGEALNFAGQKEKAFGAYERAILIAGEDIHLIRRLGEVGLDVGRFDVAKDYLLAYLNGAGADMPPDEKVTLLIRLGRACIGVDDYVEAAKFIRQALVMSPNSRDAQLCFADILEHREDYRGLVDTYDRILAGMEDAAPEEQVHLIRQAAAVQFEHLKDGDGAARRLNTALAIDGGNRTVLNDLLKIHTATKSYSSVVDVVLRIASLVDDPEELARYYLTVAKIYRHELKRPQKAVEFYEAALEQDETLEKANTAIVEILAERNEWDKLVSYYKKAIARLPKEADKQEKIDLYLPLVDIFINKLNRRADAILITEALAKLEPDNPKWPEQLGDLYGWEVEYAAKATDLHRRLLEVSPGRVPSFQMLYRIFAAAEEADKAWCAASLLTLLNQASPEERTYYHEYMPQDLPALADTLGTDQWERHLNHPDMNQIISSIFSIIAPAIIQQKGRPLPDLGFHPGAAIDVTRDPSPFAGFVNFVAISLGIQPPPLFYYGDNRIGFELLNANPPAIAADGTSAIVTDRLGLAFRLGQQLTLLRPGLYVHRLVASGTELSAWLLASIKSFVPTLPVPGELAGAVSERLAPIRSLDAGTLERLQGYVQSFVAKTADVNMKRWGRSIDYTMDRAGLLLCGDVSVAVRVLKTQIPDKAKLADRLRALTLFVISESHFKLREHIGIKLQSA